MNIEEVNGVMDLAVKELSMAQILFDAGKYRGSITHSYYAMFDAAKALLLTHDFVSKKHDAILAQFSKISCMTVSLAKMCIRIILMLKNLEKNQVMILQLISTNRKHLIV